MAKPVLSRLRIEGRWFIDEHGRRVILRGVNLGGDCKVPYPDGGTNFPSDFSNHREVSFIGRPFPIGEAGEHFSRLRAWGFNCLRLLTTWEAVEHRGPRDYDAAYLDYFAELCRLAGDYGFYIFVDFHQDVWSRMTGGGGAPCWLFEKVGIDYRRLAESGCAHVMQHLYDYARGGRQEDRYPTMSWVQNERLPANGIMWTLFFAGRDFAPGLTIDGVNVQDYMLEHYLGAQREIARRIRDLPNVLGFDSLNEPAPGWIGQPLTYRHLGPSDTNPDRAMPGLAGSPLDGLLVSHGIARSIPVLEFDPAAKAAVHKQDRTINPERISIWEAAKAIRSRMQAHGGSTTTAVSTFCAKTFSNASAIAKSTSSKTTWDHFSRASPRIFARLIPIGSCSPSLIRSRAFSDRDSPPRLPQTASTPVTGTTWSWPRPRYLARISASTC